MAVRVGNARLAGFSERWARDWAKRAAGALGRSRDDMAVVFTDAKKMRTLDRQFRGKDKATDVLSFSTGTKGDLGDIFIAPSIARKKAAKRGEDYRKYLALLIVHGVLHLGGYDHRTVKESKAMARVEERILKGCSL